jgi:hypothetical protein
MGGPPLSALEVFDWTSATKEAVVGAVDWARPIDDEPADFAERGLLGAIACLLEAANDICASVAAVDRALDLAALCQEAGDLSAALATIMRRRAP